MPDRHVVSPTISHSFKHCLRISDPGDITAILFLGHLHGDIHKKVAPVHHINSANTRDKLFGKCMGKSRDSTEYQKYLTYINIPTVQSEKANKLIMANY